MLTRNQVKEMIDHMPDTFTVDYVVEELLLLQKIEEARDQFKKGEFLTEEELDKETNQWQ